MSLLVEGANAFAVDLYARLARAPGNLVFSPHSAHSALALVCAGAGGKTAEEMARVLHLPWGGPRLHEAFASLREHLLASPRPDDASALRLTLASALWGQRGHPFTPRYIELARRFYGARLDEVDFGDPEATCRAINVWVEAETGGMIRNLVGPGMLSAATRLVLATAIFFKGMWARPFGRSTEAPFHLRSGTDVAVPMMRQVNNLEYLEDAEFQAAALPYRGGESSLVILVPRSVEGLAALEQQFTGQRLRHWMAGLEPSREVELWLPRFSMSSTLRLSTTLAAMGLAGALGPGADFTGIVEAGPFWISEVLHGARIDLDEQGTEAAAATVVLKVGAAMRPPVRREPVVLKADRPFVYLIRHNRTGAILFMGRLSDPRG